MTIEEIKNNVNIKIVKDLISIAYDINSTIDLMESIGIKVEGDIRENNIGSNLYGISTQAFIALTEYLNISDEDYTAAVESFEILYNKSISKDDAIEKCFNEIIKYTRIKEQ